MAELAQPLPEDRYRSVIVYITPKTGRFENTPPVDMVCPTCPPRVFTITPNTGTLGIEGQAPVVE